MAKTTVPQYLSATTSIIDSGDATAITIDGSENVAIGGGTNHDGAALLVSHGDSGVTTFSDNADELVIENSTNAGISILTPSNASGSIIFGDSDDDDIGKIVYSHNDNSLTFTATTTATSGNTTVGGTLTIPDGSTSAPTLTNDGDSNTGIYFPADDQIGLVVGGSRKLLVNSSGLTVNNGSLDVDGGITIDNITIDGTEIDLSSGDLTVDVAGGIILDADDSGTISFKDGGTRYGLVQKATNDFEIKSMVDDGDILFKGLDDSSTITALSLDMSDAGTASFNNDIKVADDNNYYAGSSNELAIYHTGSGNSIISHSTSASGAMYIDAGGTLNIRNSTGGGENMIVAVGDGAVTLYHDNSAKLATASDGVDITGTLDVSGAATVSSINASGGYLNGANGGIRIHSGGTKFFNVTAANAARDNHMDIGASDARFKDLYLGGSITAGGNVGIGTASPSRLLDIENSTAGGSTLVSLVSATDGNVQLLLGDTASDTQGKVLYNNDGDYMALNTNDAERIRINSSGNVGISNTIGSFHSSVLPLIVGSGSGDEGMAIFSGSSNKGKIGFADTASDDSGSYRGFLQYDHSGDNLNIGTAGSERMRIDSSGRMIIGHTASIDNGSHARMQVYHSGSSAHVAIGRWGASSSPPFLTFVKSRHTDVGSNTIVQDGDNLGKIRWRPADGNDFESEAASIYARVDGTPGQDDMPGELYFATTNDGGSTAVTRMVINSSGNVGIGTNAPQAVLEVTAPIVHGDVRNDTGSGIVDTYTNVTAHDSGEITITTGIAVSDDVSTCVITWAKGTWGSIGYDIAHSGASFAGRITGGGYHNNSDASISGHQSSTLYGSGRLTIGGSGQTLTFTLDLPQGFHPNVRAVFWCSGSVGRPDPSDFTVAWSNT